MRGGEGLEAWPFQTESYSAELQYKSVDEFKNILQH